MTSTTYRPNPDTPAVDVATSRDTYEHMKSGIRDEIMKIPLEELTEENVYDVVSEFFRQNGNFRFIIEGGKL